MIIVSECYVLPDWSSLWSSTFVKKFIDLHTSSVDFRCSAHRHAISLVVVEYILGRLDNSNIRYDLEYKNIMGPQC